MAVIEGQFEGVIARWLDLVQADAELAGLQDGFAMTLHFRRRRMHAQELGGQGVALVRPVVQLQGFRGFVQFDSGWDAHARFLNGVLARRASGPGRGALQNIARQVFVLRQFAEVAVDVGRVDHDRCAILLAGQVAGAEGDFFQQAFEQGVQAACADVLGFLVDLVGNLGDALDTFGNELDAQAFGVQQGGVLLGERGVRLGENALEILRGQGFQLDANRQAALQLGYQVARLAQETRRRR